MTSQAQDRREAKEAAPFSLPVSVERISHEDGFFSYELHGAAPEWKWLCAFYEQDDPQAKIIAEQFAAAINGSTAALQKAREEERERCAKVADNEPEPEPDVPPDVFEAAISGPIEFARATCRATKRNIAAAIRARKNES